MPRKTHCLRGHPRTPENVNRWGSCRPCARLRKQTPQVKLRRQMPKVRAREYLLKRSHARALKLDVLSHYGGAPPCCAECGETDLAKLSLDHVNGDGAEHRQELETPKGGEPFYRALRQLGYPNDPPQQVLCLKHNSAKQAREQKKIKPSRA